MLTVIRITALLLLSASAVFAIDGSGASFSHPPAAVEFSQKSATPNDGPIQDNSFLVEEAYNQEDGVIQHISGFQRWANSRDWTFTETDEWPLRTLKHQLSVTIAATHAGAFAGSGAGLGDTALNYRYQLVGNGEAKLAVAPRFSLLIPSGDSAVGRGFGGTGVQTNIPISIQHSARIVTHWNAGATWIPQARNESDQQARTVGVNLGQSVVWLVAKRFNALLETVWTSNERVLAKGQTDRFQNLYISPGVRWAYNFSSGLQIVPGVGVPVGVGPSAGEKGILLYLSFEHPFAPTHSR